LKARKKYYYKKQAGTCESEEKEEEAVSQVWSIHWQSQFMTSVSTEAMLLDSQRL
jgi:hypothetical protein